MVGKDREEQQGTVFLVQEICVRQAQDRTVLCCAQGSALMLECGEKLVLAVYWKSKTEQAGCYDRKNYG